MTEASAAKPKVIVIMPAYNAAATLSRIVESIPRDVVDEIIVVDDHSSDATVEVARKLDVTLIWHPHNVGYGGNQRTCYLEALQRGADIVVMLHPDGQYEPELIPRMIEPIIAGDADCVLGSRFAEAGAVRSSGMPRYKIIANRGLTTIENWVLKRKFTELHTGYRAYSRELLMTVPFMRNNNGFVFDSELIMQASHFGFRIAEVPAWTTYSGDVSSISFRDSTVYGLKTLGVAGRLLLHRNKIVSCRRFQP
ncbi:MAG: glycosyltransferase family 2 protein [Frankiaceae bacterium]|nr:glycosyltransferase family 2 protein [Frankiaceae bacterium]MBV9872437.1 glycosyltransferase family 2 protein [Frankiaceae bacterium]